jgi:succinyl-CoA:acetate CoA-transferase
LLNPVRQRIRGKALRGKVTSVENAARLIHDGMSVGVCSDLLPFCRALEKEGREARDLQIHLWSGVAILQADRILGKTGTIKRRIGQQTLLRKRINDRQVRYLDTPLGSFYPAIRAGEFGPLDVAILEAVSLTQEGNLIPAYRLHDMPNFARAARTVIVQVNTAYPTHFEGMHDVYLPEDPPRRKAIPISCVDDRAGTPYIPLDPDKIVAIYPSDEPEPIDADDSVDQASETIASHLLAFLREEVAQGKLPPSLLPMEIGLGMIPTAVMKAFENSEFENLEFYSAVLNDGLLGLLARQKVRAASGTGFFLSPRGEKHLLENLYEYHKKIVFRPVEIADCPEVIMRLGILALNGAIEADIYGNVNSSHIMNGDIVSGVGGAVDFAMNAHLSVILLPSTAKGGNISCIVPMTSHVDIPEHGVDLLVTEQGVADLRGLAPEERADKIIRVCAHPDYRPILREYFKRALKEAGGHEPQLPDEALSFHSRFLKTGSMKLTGGK